MTRVLPSREELGLPPLTTPEAPQRPRFSNRPRPTPIKEGPLHLGIYADLVESSPELERAKEVIGSHISFRPLDVPRAIVLSHRGVRMAQNAINTGGQPFKERAAAGLTDLYSQYGASLANRPFTPAKAVALRYPLDTDDTQWLLTYKLSGGHKDVGRLRDGILGFLEKSFSEARVALPRDLQIGSPALALGFIEFPEVLDNYGRAFSNGVLEIGGIALQAPQLLTQPGEPTFNATFQ